VALPAAFAARAKEPRLATPRTRTDGRARTRTPPAALKASLRTMKKRARITKRRLANAIGNAQAEGRDLVGAVRTEIRAKPAAAISAAVGVGVLTGLLLGRRRLH
jgi:ElaB/YqjD/DUF883 family membrane-anchored ribosome-binding protein